MGPQERPQLRETSHEYLSPPPPGRARGETEGGVCCPDSRGGTEEAQSPSHPSSAHTVGEVTLETKRKLRGSWRSCGQTDSLSPAVHTPCCPWALTSGQLTSICPRSSCDGHRAEGCAFNEHGAGLFPAAGDSHCGGLYKHLNKVGEGIKLV